MTCSFEKERDCEEGNLRIYVAKKHTLTCGSSSTGFRFLEVATKKGMLAVL